jgi:C4-dicarboxylate-specific signal transduction histidine kinase
VLDLTERKRSEQEAREAERRYHQMQLRLADANRVATVGHLSASIAHEVNQPLSGITINAGTCLRKLEADPPNLGIALEAARRIVRDGKRAAEVITRLRAIFARKEFSLQAMDLNDATREVIASCQSEFQRNTWSGTGLSFSRSSTTCCAMLWKQWATSARVPGS